MEMQDDDPDALKIVLNIAHLRFEAVPQSLDFKQLLSLAILTDKYQATRVLRPWIADWTMDLTRFVGKPGYEECAWIAWEFGLEVEFEHIVTYLILHAKVDHEGSCLVDDEYLESKQLPSGLIESILDVRYTTIERLLGIPYDYMGRVENKEHAAGLCRLSKAECTALSFESLMLGLKSLELGLSQPDTCDITSSISELARGLAMISIYRYEDGHHRYRHYSDDSHDECNIQGDLRERVKKVLEDVPSGMTENHRNHIRTQVHLLRGRS
ncbi:hypothetical protein LTR17_024728 [Elasticomyces elasticus]|nr:hypothetical protein LTR17_024728 [Elasticomyces elasticus]